MKAIMVMFDSLNRHMLSPYGCDWVHTPNFQRLADRAVTFDTNYIGSFPCMPARRELHTGRYNFLHRSWGPVEPFDDSAPVLLSTAGVRTHLITDHYHYWEEGGATYHTRYGAAEFSRGQEADRWKTNLNKDVKDLESGNYTTGRDWMIDQYFANRQHMQTEDQLPQAKTFAMAQEFLKTNQAADNWFLQIETFDPHEPYHVPAKYIEMYEDAYDGPHFDWPPYGSCKDAPRDLIKHFRVLNAALTTMCDTYLGKVLDLMDELNLWDDTMLIVNTDHGFMLGEHDWWAKGVMPMYEEVARTPLFVWDPRTGVRGQRRRSLVQTIDLPATLLEHFNVDRPADMRGVPLQQTIADDSPVREAALFGVFGGQMNVTDGRYVYMRAHAGEANEPLNEYTLMPTHVWRTFAVDELQDIQLAEPFSFTKGCRVMKIAGRRGRNKNLENTLLFDLQADPEQEAPIDDPEVERMMIEHMVRVMKANDAPVEQYERLGLAEPTD